MPAISYKLKKLDSQYKQAKIVEFKNAVLSKSTEFPAAMFYVQGPEDMDAIKRYYFQTHPDDHIFGYTIPFHKLAEFVPALIKNVPHETIFMCDINSEIYWSNTLRPDIVKFFAEYTAIPEKIKNKIGGITSTEKFKDRIKIHRDFFRDVVKDKKMLTKLLTSYINRQHGYQVEILSSFAPLLLDKNHLDFAEECYTLTKRLYHSETNDIELNGRIIGLYANFHTQFLASRANVNEFLKMVERVEPKALIFKISNLKDIRERKKTIYDNYELLIKGIGDVSQAMQIPSFYFATHTAGYKAQTKGIDVFCEPFRNAESFEKKVQLSKQQLKLLYEKDPLFKGGRIYDIKTGDLISRREFQNTRLTSEGVDSLVPYIASMKPEKITAMTDKSFREFSKIVLLMSRNYEEEELHKGIVKGDINPILNKIAKWEGLKIPK